MFVNRENLSRLFLCQGAYTVVILIFHPLFPSYSSKGGGSGGGDGIDGGGGDDGDYEDQSNGVK